MDKQTMQDTFDCMMSWSPAQVLMYKMNNDICEKWADQMDPMSGMFPAGYYEDMRVLAGTFALKFTDPRGTAWKNAVREGAVTVH